MHEAATSTPNSSKQVTGQRMDGWAFDVTEFAGADVFVLGARARLRVRSDLLFVLD
jgi:hypothetical protein